MVYSGGDTAAGLGREIGAGRLDPRELAESCLDAAQAHPQSARIFARLTPERARAEADAARGRSRSGTRRGPLDGVPLAWKDNVDSAGTATEAGTRLLAGRVPEEDATVLGRAGAAGLVCLGKTHLSELAFSGLGVNPMTATAPNAHDPDLAPGGSSSGTAAAVALGLAPAGIGTDTGGSVRIPAAWNGLVGLKTTFGLLPNDGVVALAESLDTVGPLTRTVADAALVLAALTGAAPVDEPDPAPRLLVSGTITGEGCDVEVTRAFSAATARLAQAGTALEETAVPEFAEALDIAARMSSIVNFDAWKAWGATIEANPGVMYPMIEKRFRQGADIDPDRDRMARAALSALRERLIARMGAGFVICPTVACLPPSAERLLAEEAFYTERNLLALRNTRLANLLGLSALTLPIPENTMTGLMLVAPPGAEDRLLAAGLTLERRLAG